MKTGYIIYTQFEMNRNKYFIEKLLSASDKFNIKLTLLIFEKIKIINEEDLILCYEDKVLPVVDFVILRMMNYYLAKIFEKKGIKVYNSSEISKIADNKYVTYLKIKEIGIPVMETFLDSDINEKKLFFPNVTKPIDSKGGDRVFFNKNIEEYKNNIKSYDDTHYIIQKVASDIGYDLRVYVIGEKIIAPILRISKDGFLSNFCRGGDAILYDLNNEEKEIVNKIINNINFDYVGIDFLFDNGKMVLNEIENVVGARMVYTKTDIDIAELFIEHIANT